MIKWLLALSFILSFADKLLVQVDDSELSKLVLIQATVLIAQFKGGEAMLHKHTAAVGGRGYEGMPLVSSPSHMEGAKWPSINCLNVCDHSQKAWICVHLESVSKLIYVRHIFTSMC